MMYVFLIVSWLLQWFSVIRSLQITSNVCRLILNFHFYVWDSNQRPAELKVSAESPCQVSQLLSSHYCMTLKTASMSLLAYHDTKWPFKFLPDIGSHLLVGWDKISTVVSSPGVSKLVHSVDGVTFRGLFYSISPVISRRTTCLTFL